MNHWAYPLHVYPRGLVITAVVSVSLRSRTMERHFASQQSAKLFVQ